jgi:hypothetical protein
MAVFGDGVVAAVSAGSTGVVITVFRAESIGGAAVFAESFLGFTGTGVFFILSLCGCLTAFDVSGFGFAAPEVSLTGCLAALVVSVVAGDGTGFCAAVSLSVFTAGFIVSLCTGFASDGFAFKAVSFAGCRDGDNAGRDESAAGLFGVGFASESCVFFTVAVFRESVSRTAAVTMCSLPLREVSLTVCNAAVVLASIFFILFLFTAGMAGVSTVFFEVRLMISGGRAGVSPAVSGTVAVCCV